MNKKHLKEIMTIVLMTLILLTINTGEVKAGLQANPNTQYTKKDTIANWLTNFRKMEEAGGTMGLSETLSTDLTSAESNNIDVHMMKSTEYGAIAILSASGYGNPSNNRTITSTTGNNTGIMLHTGYHERVAGGLVTDQISSVNSRYYDIYTTNQTSAKIGDALGKDSTTNPGCTGWHEALYKSWVGGGTYYFMRGNGGIFSFYSDSFVTEASLYCRGVAMCGTGL